MRLPPQWLRAIVETGMEREGAVFDVLIRLVHQIVCGVRIAIEALLPNFCMVKLAIMVEKIDSGL